MRKEWLSALLLFLVACAGLPSGTAAPQSPLVPSPTPPRATVIPWPSPTPVDQPRNGPSPTPITPTATAVPEITLMFTGNIVPARCVQAEVEKRGGDPAYLYREVAPLLRQADLAIGGALAAALSDYPPMTGCRNTFVLVGRTYHARALAQAGIDIINVATNHIKNCGLLNCGDRAFLDTLQALQQAGIQVVGGGHNLEEALQPVVVDIQGVRFGFAGWSALEARYYAGPDHPGTAPLTPEAVEASFQQARAMGADVLIALPHWGPEYTYTPSYLQRQAARMLVEKGATLVVGNHPHVVQGIERIKGVLVFYSLGSFVFDQTWRRDTRQSVLLEVIFRGPHLHRWRLIPVYYDETGAVHLARGRMAEEILGHIQQATAFPLPTSPAP